MEAVGAGYGIEIRVIIADILTTKIYYRDIQVLKTYGAAPYAASLKKLEKDVKELQTKVNEKIGEQPTCQPLPKPINTLVVSF